MAKLPSINDVNLSRLRSWIYDRLTEQAVDGIYDDELADALGVPYDASVSEPGENATEEEWIISMTSRITTFGICIMRLLINCCEVMRS